jgi:hypothetical protein
MAGLIADRQEMRYQDRQRGRLVYRHAGRRALTKRVAGRSTSRLVRQEGQDGPQRQRQADRLVNRQAGRLVTRLAGRPADRKVGMHVSDGKAKRPTGQNRSDIERNMQTGRYKEAGNLPGG